MRIFMALLAKLWRCLEVDMKQRRLQVWRLVAVNAAGRAVRAQQGESGLRVIELRQLFPGLR